MKSFCSTLYYTLNNSYPEFKTAFRTLLSRKNRYVRTVYKTPMYYLIIILYFTSGRDTERKSSRGELGKRRGQERKGLSAGQIKFRAERNHDE